MTTYDKSDINKGFSWQMAYEISPYVSVIKAHSKLQRHPSYDRIAANFVAQHEKVGNWPITFVL